jgi:hypothetical protein
LFPFAASATFSRNHYLIFVFAFAVTKRFLCVLACLVVAVMSEAGYFSLGGSTLNVSIELFVENRRRLVEEVRKVAPNNSVIVLQGGIEKNRYNTDAEDLPFRQVGLE